MKKKYYVILFVFISFLPISFCSGKHSQSRYNTIDLAYDFSNKLTTFDPAYCGHIVTDFVLKQFYNTLYELYFFKGRYYILPSISENIPKISNNNKTLTINFKKGLLFSNDQCFKSKTRELTVHDFIYSIKRNVLLPDSNNYTLILKISGFNHYRTSFLKKVQELSANTKIVGIKNTKKNSIDIEFNNTVNSEFIKTIPIYAKDCNDSSQLAADDILIINSKDNKSISLLLRKMKFPVDDCFKSASNPQGYGRLVNIEDLMYSIKKYAMTEDSQKLRSILDIKGMKEIHTVFQNLLNNFIREDLNGLRAIDDHTLVINLEKAEPDFNYYLTLRNFAIYPQEAVSYYGINFAENPVGTGPFKLEKWEEKEKDGIAEQVILSKNKNYNNSFNYTVDQKNTNSNPIFNKKEFTYIDYVTISFLKNDDAVTEAFLSGKTDYIDTKYSKSITDTSTLLKDIFISKNISKKYQNLKSIDVQNYKVLNPDISYIAFNMNAPFVGNNALEQKVIQINEFVSVKKRKNKKSKKVIKDIVKTKNYKVENTKYLRQALTVAFDFEKYISSFYTEAENAQWIIPTSIWKDNFTNFYKKQRSESERIKLVKDLLKKAGYDSSNGKNIPILELDVPEYGQFRANHFKNNLTKYGINIKVNTHKNFNDMLKKIYSGNVQMFMMNYSSYLPIPEIFLKFLYSKEDSLGRLTNYHNPAYNKLYEEYLTSYGARRDALIRQMRDIAVEDAVYIPLIHSVSELFVHAHVKNMVLNPLFSNQFQYMKVDPARKERLIKRLDKQHPVSTATKLWYDFLDFIDNVITKIKKLLVTYRSSL